MIEIDVEILASQIARELARAVIPLYSPTDRHSVACIGSGVLIESNRGPTIFTADHVLAGDIKRRPLYTRGVLHAQMIELHAFEVAVAKSNRPHHGANLDVARIAIDLSCAQQLQDSGCIFVACREAIYESHERTLYTAVGFPQALNLPLDAAAPQDEERGQNSVLMIHTSRVAADEYRRFGRNPIDNLLLRLHPSKLRRMKLDEHGEVYRRQPFGLSGGAIFCMGTPEEIAARSRGEFAAMLTDCQWKKGLLVGATPAVLNKLCEEDEMLQSET